MSGIGFFRGEETGAGLLLLGAVKRRSLRWPGHWLASLAHKFPRLLCRRPTDEEFDFRKQQGFTGSSVLGVVQALSVGIADTLVRLLQPHTSSCAAQRRTAHSQAC